MVRTVTRIALNTAVSRRMLIARGDGRWWNAIAPTTTPLAQPNTNQGRSSSRDTVHRNRYRSNQARQIIVLAPTTRWDSHGPVVSGPDATMAARSAPMSTRARLANRDHTRARAA